MPGRDIADLAGGFLGGESSNKNFVVANSQTVGPFRVAGSQVTIQFSPRPNYVSGPVPTFASLVIEGSLDKKNWYAISGTPTITATGLYTFPVMTPWIRIRGNFSTAEGTIYVYSLR